MRIEKRKKTIEYNVYITSDGKEFENSLSAENHEKLMTGQKKICNKCGGKGKINERTEKHKDTWSLKYEEVATFDICSECGGKGYFELTWK